jgi:Tol biopolymer transport system component
MATVAVGFVVKSVLGPSNRFPTLNPSHRRLTAGAGWEGQPAVSPDGTMVAYTSGAAGNPDIWVVRAQGGDPLRLTRDPASDTDPTWFPDGEAIAFVSNRGASPSIWRIPPLGGSPVRLLPDAEDPAISPDGTRIAFSRPDSAGLYRIGVAPLDDPTPARAITGDDDGLWGHTDPAWSPDGRTLCYADFKDLWLVPAEGGAARRLTHAGAADQGPVWSPDGRFILFSSFPDQALTLWCVRVSDGARHRLTTGTSDEGEPSLSRDGRWLAYSVSHTNPDIEVLDRVTRLRTRIPGGAVDESPAVAPDGSAVAFSSDRLGSYDLWLQPIEGGRLAGAARRLTDHPGSAAVPAFSPDGRWLAYHRIVDEQRDIWMVPAAGGPPRRITDDPANEVHPAFSPDGSTLAFVSDRGGSDQVWVAPLAGDQLLGEPRLVTPDEVSHLFPAWSPDGTRIACVIEAGYGREVAVFGVDSGSEAPWLSDGVDAHRVQWAASGDELLVAGTWGSDRVTVRLLSIGDGRSRPLEPALDLGTSGLESLSFAWDGAGRIVAYEVYERVGDLWLAETDLGRRWGAPWR